MNKGELVKLVAANTEPSQKDVDKAITATLQAIIDHVGSGGKVTLVSFGTFEAIHTAEREGRNPSTGEPITIPASIRPKFKAGKEFKTACNGEADTEAAE